MAADSSIRISGHLLPAELVENTLGYLDAEALGALLCVSSAFRQAAEDAGAWRELARAAHARGAQVGQQWRQLLPSAERRPLPTAGPRSYEATPLPASGSAVRRRGVACSVRPAGGAVESLAEVCGAGATVFALCRAQPAVRLLQRQAADGTALLGKPLPVAGAPSSARIVAAGGWEDGAACCAIAGPGGAAVLWAPGAAGLGDAGAVRPAMRWGAGVAPVRLWTAPGGVLAALDSRHAVCVAPHPPGGGGAEEEEQEWARPVLHLSHPAPPVGAPPPQAALSPDGSHICAQTGGPGALARVWDLSTQQVSAQLTERGALHCVYWSFQEGLHCLTSPRADCLTLCVYDLRAGPSPQIRQQLGRLGGVTASCVCAGARLAAVACGERLCLINLRRPKRSSVQWAPIPVYCPADTLRGPIISAAAAEPIGRFATLSRNSELRLWDLASLAADAGMHRAGPPRPARGGYGDSRRSAPPARGDPRRSATRAEAAEQLREVLRSRRHSNSDDWDLSP
eukprot:TRINITY_DN26096_c0_g1_i1.p1 TRINITY_DN26096_c0_g1~~TRINITY_DN26096_c0_g1_i1.p1  ORF type:complete len:549 (+),score=138.77 TRINITY_DN26096_c0_g1_i1:114-1649(+)